jgi:hypothetical protein
MLQILSFAIGKVGVDEIEKKERGRWRDRMQQLLKDVGSQKDNPLRIDRDKDG